MKRWLFLAYGVGGYVSFLAVYVYLAGFVGNFLVPKSIDAPLAGQPLQAVAIDLLLVAIFAVQHSVMARPAFKRLWTRMVPQPVERATYVWAANAVTMLLVWQWRPLGAVIWNVDEPVARELLWMLFVAGWLAVPLVTVLINHFDLFGTRQVWLFWRKQPYTDLPFRTPAVYAHVRHPLYLGWAVAFWATPTMTAGHALFAASMTVYMVLASLLEERDLVLHFGERYREYQENVGRFMPRFARAGRNGKALEKAQRGASPAVVIANGRAAETS